MGRKYLEQFMFILAPSPTPLLALIITSYVTHHLPRDHIDDPDDDNDGIPDMQDDDDDGDGIKDREVTFYLK